MFQHIFCASVPLAPWSQNHVKTTNPAHPSVVAVPEFDVSIASQKLCVGLSTQRTNKSQHRSPSPAKLMRERNDGSDKWLLSRTKLDNT